METTPSDPARPVQRVDVEDGPLLLRGAAQVRVDEVDHPTTRPVVAVCRCDRSSRLPWCDGTHHLLRRRGG